MKRYLQIKKCENDSHLIIGFVAWLIYTYIFIFIPKTLGESIARVDLCS